MEYLKKITQESFEKTKVVSDENFSIFNHIQVGYTRWIMCQINPYIQGFLNIFDMMVSSLKLFTNNYNIINLQSVFRERNIRNFIKEKLLIKEIIDLPNINISKIQEEYSILKKKTDNIKLYIENIKNSFPKTTNHHFKKLLFLDIEKYIMKFYEEDFYELKKLEIFLKKKDDLTKLNEHLILFQEYGSLLPFYLFCKKTFILNNIFPFCFFLKNKIFFIFKILKFPFSFSIDNFYFLSKKINKVLPMTDKYKSYLSVKLTLEEKKRVENLRNLILFEKIKIEKLLFHSVFGLSLFSSYLYEKFQNFLEENVQNFFQNIFFSLFKTIIKETDLFIEELLISKKGNKQFCEVIQVLNQNILYKYNLPNILIQCLDYKDQLLIEKYIINNINYYYDLNKYNRFIKTIEIPDPIAITQYEISGKKINLKKTMNQIFFSNLQEVKLFFASRYISFNGETNFLQDIFYRILKTNSQFYSFFKNFKINFIECITIFSLEKICGSRSFGHNIHSSITHLFIEHIEDLYKDKFILSFSYDINLVDEAVIDRFPYVILLQEYVFIKEYIIIVKKYLIELMMKNNEIIFEKNFEKEIWNIAYKIYQSNWEISEIKIFFEYILSDKVIKRYGKITTKQIENMIKEGIK